MSLNDDYGLWGQGAGGELRDAAADRLAEAVEKQDAQVARVRGFVGQGYGSAYAEAVAVCHVNPIGRHYSDGRPAVREDYEAALAKATAAIKAAATEAQLLSYDGSIKLGGAGGWALLQEFPIDGDVAVELTIAERNAL